MRVEVLDTRVTDIAALCGMADESHSNPLSEIMAQGRHALARDDR